eukprot:g23868.t1
MQKYEAWEATGLHTEFFSEEEVFRGVKMWKECDPDQLERVVAWWDENDLLGLPVDPGPTVLSSWRR